jgi:hypothetical protein
MALSPFFVMDSQSLSVAGLLPSTTPMFLT